MKLEKGQWFEYPLTGGLPDTLKVCTGSWDARTVVKTISKYQALAFIRWHGRGVWRNIKRHGRWIDVRVVGDHDAWFEGTT